jgi:putative spermidine/putrescine transport system ATP-binding protein
MADRVAVFNAGKIAQVGTPQEIYDRPRTRFVADFVGSANVLPPALAVRFGAPGWASLRPEAIRLAGADAAVTGTVASTRYLGAGTRLAVAVDGGEVALVVPAGTPVPAPGTRIGLAWEPAALNPLAEA